MITWMLYMIFVPTTAAELCTWAWCGFWFDGFVIGKIFQIIEKVLDNRRK